MHVILLFVKTVLNRLPAPLRQLLYDLLFQLRARIRPLYERFGNKGEASINLKNLFAG
jgi:predicted DCC family thiol-disulfide oxidoreductase YuxK